MIDIAVYVYEYFHDFVSYIKVHYHKSEDYNFK